MMVRRTQALFDAMSGDHLFREQFVTDPAQVYTEYAHGASLDRHRADVINQFLYAVLACDDLLQWLIDYRKECQGIPPSDAELATRFTRAVVDNNAHHVALALTRASSEREPIFPFDPAIKDVVFGVHGRGDRGFQTNLITEGLTDAEFSTEVSTATESSPGTGTMISTPPAPIPPITSLTTITNLGPLAEAFPGFDDGAAQLVIEAVRSFAAELRDGGALDDVGQG